MPAAAEAIRRQLLQPQIPSAVRPLLRWKARSALSVFAPKMPSSVLVLYPRAFYQCQVIRQNYKKTGGP